MDTWNDTFVQIFEYTRITGHSQSVHAHLELTGCYRGNSLDLIALRGKTPVYNGSGNSFGLSISCARSQNLSRFDIIRLSQ